MKDNVRDVIAVVDMRSTCLCAIDTIIRLDDPEEKLYTCNNCVFKDTIACPPKIRTLIDYESVLV